MKSWNAIDWAILLLAFSVIIAISEPMIIRLATGYALSDNAANVLNTYTQSVGSGLLLLIIKKISDKR